MKRLVVTAVSAVYFVISAMGGILFPLLMGMLTGLNPDIRGTISSLANSVMYGATTIGSWTAGLLYGRFHGFTAVGTFAAVSMAVSLFVFKGSGWSKRNETLVARHDQVSPTRVV
ncbi:hypothetical protein [Paenibacillus sp.]|jgi:predicted MFS family arabinose efflux permease|uniref:hypothetical protein n=1 Tax=Paenibacillus sp. TaxID=58172 RepID=UPI00282CEF20|nr:hypothetical protein [Paenibacillus sp.]MDR0266969.1 hypothetical protein [Paenibacillus sp.]